jgi:ribosomal protein S18 acetylase RimI-like enzyme
MLLKNHLKNIGADILELHVFSDNEPAVRLYRSSGFREVKKTITMKKTF